MKSVSVFCGSSSGSDDIFQQQARELGITLAQQGITVIYGGARIGLMGAVANGALSYDGKVIGVIPTFLQSKEIAHDGLTQLILVESMHQRKARMNDLSDGIIALPGGFGTLEEFFEMLTWAQLGLHKKPIGILNTDGFYDPLIALIQAMVDKGFLKTINQQMVLVSSDIDDLLIQMKNYVAPITGKWIDKKTT